MTPKDVHDLVAVTCEYVIPSQKGDFEDEIKLGILRWGDFPGLSKQVQCDHRVPIRRRQEGQREERRCNNGNKGWTDSL